MYLRIVLYLLCLYSLFNEFDEFREKFIQESLDILEITIVIEYNVPERKRIRSGKMNFSKHRVRERQMLSELLTYCDKVLTHRRKVDERYQYLSSCISTRTGGVEITYGDRKNAMITNKLLTAIRYDERNDFFYFLEKIHIGKTTLENRILIEEKEDFYAYLDHLVDKTFGSVGEGE